VALAFVPYLLSSVMERMTAGTTQTKPTVVSRIIHNVQKLFLNATFLLTDPLFFFLSV